MEMNNETKKFSFLKYIIGAVVVLVFAIGLAFNYAIKNTFVYAATYNELCDGFSFNVSSASSESSSGKSLTVTATGTAGGVCSNASSKTSTITITNTFSQAGTLIFDYSVTLNNGTIKIGDTSIKTSGNYSNEIAAGGKITITITSAAAATSTTLNMTNIISQFDINANITFYVADEGGHYRVSYGDVIEEITESKIETINAENSITFTALPLTGYKLFCWEIDGQRINYLTPTFVQSFTSNTTIKPIFCDSDAAIFTTKAGGYYMSLTEANNAAKNASGNGKIIVPVGTTTTIPSGNYEISSGVTLLVPYNDNNDYSSGTLTAPTTTQTFVAPTLYKRLILSDGVRIDVSGNICINSVVSGAGQSNGHNGTPSGPHGELHLNSNSLIELKSGSKFTCWGYTSGTGTINALNGSNVYECFQIKDFRGGSATSDMIGNSQKIMPFNQYFVQNIECYLKMNSGSKENLFSCVTLSIVGTQTMSPTLIGGTSDTAMFKITSGYVKKYYNVSTDRLEIEIVGDVAISNLSMKISTYSIDSSKYVLPINSNMDIKVLSGTLSTNSNQAIFMMPESSLTVENGANFIVNSNMYLYDKTNWIKGYTYNEVGYKIDYISARDRNTCSNTSTRMNGYPHDGATLDINGTVTISSTGNIFTTIGTNDTYANVISSEKTGKITRKTDANVSTYQYTSSNSTSSYATISCITVKLKNGDESFYINDKDVTIIEYDFNGDKWGIDEETIYTYTIIFKYNNEIIEQSFNSNETYTFPNSSIFTNVPDYILKLWNPSNIVHGSYSPGETIEGSEGSALDGEEYTPYFGGFLQDGNDWYFIDYYGATIDDKVKGLYRTKSPSGDSINVYYFDSSTGRLLIDSNNSSSIIQYNNDYYYINPDGILSTTGGLVEYTYFDVTNMQQITDYYYFGQDNKAYKEGIYYIKTDNQIYTSGFYNFDSQGRLIGKIVHGLIKTADGDYYYIDSNNNLYYEDINFEDNTSVVRNKTVYVTNFDNSIPLDEQIIGLYYFGSDGKLISYKEVS